MSIIYDALKKVEKNQLIDLETKSDKVDKGKSKTKVYLLYALIICLGFFIANISFAILGKLLQSKPANLKPDVNIVKEPVIEPPPIQTASPVVAEVQIKPEPLATPKPVLALSGVFFSQDEGYALINNKIVKVGDVVEGAKVERITLEEVELVFEGEPIKLSGNK